MSESRGSWLGCLVVTGTTVLSFVGGLLTGWLL